MRIGADVSLDRKYRYLWWCEFEECSLMSDFVAPQTIAFVLLNPSTADERAKDSTATRVCNYAKRDNFSRVEIYNLYAGRTFDPDVLFAMEDPVGPLNLQYWDRIRKSDSKIVCGWGSFAKAKKQIDLFLEFMEGRELFCLGISKGGNPKHPLYLKKDEKFIRFRP